MGFARMLISTQRYLESLTNILAGGTTHYTYFDYDLLGNLYRVSVLLIACVMLRRALREVSSLDAPRRWRLMPLNELQGRARHSVRALPESRTTVRTE
jgi:hypothetical protein